MPERCDEPYEIITVLPANGKPLVDCMFGRRRDMLIPFAKLPSLIALFKTKALGRVTAPASVML